MMYDLLIQHASIVDGTGRDAFSADVAIQDGKLVGAVTHVLVSDPTKGYGIFIENMLEEAR